VEAKDAVALDLADERLYAGTFRLLLRDLLRLRERFSRLEHHRELGTELDDVVRGECVDVLGERSLR
jgi:hypothetical protein